MAKTTTTPTDEGFLSHFDSASILTGVLGLVSMAYPPAAPIIAIIEKAAPYIIAARPLIEAGIKEGGNAFEAAQKAAPQLSKAIKDLTSVMMAGGNTAFGKTPAASTENITRAVFGFRQRTIEEDNRWMNESTRAIESGNVG